MKFLQDALAYPVHFFTETVPMLMNVSLGALGDLLDAIGNVNTIITLLPIIVPAILWIVKYILTRED